MSSSAIPAHRSSRAGRPYTVAAYVLTVLSFLAPAVLACAAIAAGLTGAARGDRAGRTAAVVAAVVLVLQVTFFVLWSFGVIRWPR
jgi:hypothetical protein